MKLTLELPKITVLIGSRILAIDGHHCRWAFDYCG